MIKIKDLKSGQRAQILKVHSGNKTYRHRLLAMGLIPGTTFLVSRVAPLGDPIEILVRGFGLSLRKQEADLLQIALIPSS